MYDKVIMKCWALDPKERPTASDICSSLSKLFLGENAKDYYYAKGQLTDEEADFYTYCSNVFQKDSIYQNNPMSMNKQSDDYLEVENSTDNYMNTSRRPPGGSKINEQIYENNATLVERGQINDKKKGDPLYLQLIG